jgi:hypothetical protein
MQARRELLDSARVDRDHSENRLTELLATVLDTHEVFTGSLLRHLGLTTGSTYEVSTQVAVAEGCRPDMEIVALDSAGAATARIWSEHKVGAGFRDQQREDYLAALEDTLVPGKLLVIAAAREAVDMEGDAPGWVSMTWSEIAHLANLAGQRVSEDRMWREGALAPTAEARQRLLHEFIWYLEEEGLAVLNPINDHVIGAFAEAGEAFKVLFELAERSTEELGDYKGADIEYDDENFQQVWVHFDVPGSSWLIGLKNAGWNGYAELHFNVRDEWSLEPKGSPAIGIGYTIDPALHDALSANVDWVRRLEAEGFGLRVVEGWLRCYRTKQLSDLAADHDTLSGQIESLKSWVSAGLGQLEELAPEPIAWPKPRRRGPR